MRKQFSFFLMIYIAYDTVITQSIGNVTILIPKYIKTMVCQGKLGSNSETD